MADKIANPRRIKTGIVRLSFPSLFTPDSFDKDDDNTQKKYSAVFLIKKGDKKTLALIRAAEKAAVEDEYPGGRNLPKKFRGSTLKDGDEEEYDGFEGCWSVRASSTDRPGITSFPAREPVTDENRVYAGCYVRASLYLACYDMKGNRGVTAYLNNVQLMSDGPRLDSRKTAADDFDDDFDVDPTELAALADGAGTTPGPAEDDDDLFEDDEPTKDEDDDFGF